MNELYDIIGDIFNPLTNPFAPKRNNDNVEEAEIIEEVKDGGR
jgi:hypothetical protein